MMVFSPTHFQSSKAHTRNLRYHHTISRSTYYREPSDTMPRTCRPVLYTLLASLALGAHAGITKCGGTSFPADPWPSYIYGDLSGYADQFCAGIQNKQGPYEQNFYPYYGETWQIQLQAIVKQGFKVDHCAQAFDDIINQCIALHTDGAWEDTSAGNEFYFLWINPDLA